MTNRRRWPRLAAASWVRTCWKIVLEQGKYHQVKRMLAAAGIIRSALQRTAIGGLQLESLELEEGEWTYLDAEQMALLAPDAE